MRQFLALAVIIILFSACTRDNKTTDTGTKKDSTRQNNTGKNTATDPQNAGDTKSSNTKDTIISSLINVEYGISRLPPTLKGYNGSIIAMAKWEDKLGANVLFVTETEVQTKGDNRSKELYAYHYNITDKENKLIL